MGLFDLAGRIALVTGSSKGIGFALSRGLAAHGARVILNGRDAGTLAEAAARLTAEGHTVETSGFDVTNAEAVQGAIATIEADVGPLDILINNAGMQHRAPLETFPVSMWQTLLTTNVTSAFLVGQAVAQRMIPRRRGRIVNVCSVQSELARTGIAPYTASKGALKMLTKGMATDWGRYNIQVNGLAPGYFKTELNQALVDDETFSAWLTARTPAGRWGDVEELVGAAVFLSSDAASFVNGTILYVDGGITSCL